MTKNLVIAILVAIIATGGVLSAIAASQTVETSANVEVRVWQSVSSGALYLSTRPEGGSWTTHDDEALDMSEMSRSGSFRQSSFVTVSVPVMVDVEIPEPEPAEETTPEATSTPAPETSQALPGSGANDGDDWQYHESLSSWSNNLLGDITLWIGCLELDLGTTVLPHASMHYDGYHFDDSRRVSYRIDGGPVETESWAADYVSGGTSRVTPSTAFLEKLRNADTLTIQILITTETLDVTGAGAVMSDLGCFD